MSKQFAEKILEQETQTIEERYRPRQAEGRTTHLHESSNERLRQIAQRCEDFDELDPKSSSLQEEQERELSPEMEHERQVERIKPAKPAQHNLHEDGEKFACQGLYDGQSEAYMTAFQALHDSTAAKFLKQSQVAGLDKDGRVLVTMAFKRSTTSRKKNFVSDIYQRTVQWVVVIGGRSCPSLFSDNAARMLIISAFEANALYKRMQASQITSLHLYKARTNFGSAPLDDLMFHMVTAGSSSSIPLSLVVRLNLFAGQLYISSYDDYLEICKFLGLCAKAVTQEMADKGWEIDGTGFILRDGQGRVGGESGLEQSPVNLFKTLLSKIRKNGESIAKTHMGELLDGKLFQRSDFE